MGGVSLTQRRKGAKILASTHSVGAGAIFTAEDAEGAETA